VYFRVACWQAAVARYPAGGWQVAVVDEMACLSAFCFAEILRKQDRRS
jgi:hypothetical protein